MESKVTLLERIVLELFQQDPTKAMPTSQISENLSIPQKSISACFATIRKFSPEWFSLYIQERKIAKGKRLISYYSLVTGRGVPPVDIMSAYKSAQKAKTDRVVKQEKIKQVATKKADKIVTKAVDKIVTKAVDKEIVKVLSKAKSWNIAGEIIIAGIQISVCLNIEPSSRTIQ